MTASTSCKVWGGNNVHSHGLSWTIGAHLGRYKVCTIQARLQPTCPTPDHIKLLLASLSGVSGGEELYTYWHSLGMTSVSVSLTKLKPWLTCVDTLKGRKGAKAVCHPSCCTCCS